MRKAESSGGIGLAGVLFIVFLVLKLTGLITWSWWWIAAPLWIGVAVLLVYLLLALIGLAVAGIVACLIGK